MDKWNSNEQNSILITKEFLHGNVKLKNKSPIKKRKEK